MKSKVDSRIRMDFTPFLQVEKEKLNSKKRELDVKRELIVKALHEVDAEIIQTLSQINGGLERSLAPKFNKRTGKWMFSCIECGGWEESETAGATFCSSCGKERR